MFTRINVKQKLRTPIKPTMSYAKTRKRKTKIARTAAALLQIVMAGRPVPHFMLICKRLDHPVLNLGNVSKRKKIAQQGPGTITTVRKNTHQQQSTSKSRAGVMTIVLAMLSAVVRIFGTVAVKSVLTVSIGVYASRTKCIRVSQSTLIA